MSGSHCHQRRKEHSKKFSTMHFFSELAVISEKFLIAILISTVHLVITLSTIKYSDLSPLSIERVLW